LKQEFLEAIQKIRPVNLELEKEAYQHLDNLTKPPRSLGRLEQIAARIYAIQEGECKPYPFRIYTLAADHGVAGKGVSPYPQEVTRQMVLNFLRGGAAINVLCQTCGVELKVVDIGVKGETFPEHPNLIQYKIKPGTGDITQEPAMTEEECLQALCLGINLANQAKQEGIKALGIGEMGIGNTTPSTALYAAYLNLPPQKLTGPGAGLKPEKVKQKAKLIEQALQTHQQTVAGKDPLAILAALGGLEIAGMAGIILGAALNKMPVVIDGFIATASFLASYQLDPKVKEYAFFSHCSAETAHQKILNLLEVRPLLDLDLRLGEGTGAALGLFLLKASANIFNQMATFDSAGVSKAQD